MAKLSFIQCRPRHHATPHHHHIHVIFLSAHSVFHHQQTIQGYVLNLICECPLGVCSKRWPNFHIMPVPIVFQYRRTLFFLCLHDTDLKWIYATTFDCVSIFYPTTQSFPFLFPFRPIECDLSKRVKPQRVCQRMCVCMDVRKVKTKVKSKHSVSTSYFSSFKPLNIARICEHEAFNNPSY